MSVLWESTLWECCTPSCVALGFTGLGTAQPLGKAMPPTSPSLFFWESPLEAGGGLKFTKLISKLGLRELL